MHTKAVMKRENGIDYPARDYAFVPDPLRSATWRLRLTETPGKISVAQLGRAAAALGPGGFRGNRVEIPAAALAAVKRRIRAEYRKLGVSEQKIPQSVKSFGESPTFWLQKDQNGQYRWFSVYSNNFRDDDRPSEIISKESHETFLSLVEEGIVDYPEAWLWHVPVAWGKADWLDFADGFALASGTVYPGFEGVAEFLAKEADLAVSHGMPSHLIRRDPSDPSVIVRHVTAEISPLPRSAAANKLTGFVVLKGEKTMPLTAAKKEFLKKAGLDDNFISDLEVALKEAGESALEAGIESKEADEAPAAQEEQPEAQAAAEPPVEEKAAKMPPKKGGKMDEEDEEEMPRKKKEADEAPAAPAPTYVTVEEAAAVFQELFTPMLQAMQTLTARVDAVTKELGDLKRSDAEKIAATKEATPTLSLMDIVRKNIIGSDATRIDGRLSLGKDGPVEKEYTPPTAQATLSPMVNGFIQANQKQ